MIYDEERLESMFWDFDHQRKHTGEERLEFKKCLRGYASHMDDKSKSWIGIDQADRESIYERAEYIMDHSINMSWRDAIVQVTESILKEKNFQQHSKEATGMHKQIEMFTYKE